MHTDLRLIDWTPFLVAPSLLLQFVSPSISNRLVPFDNMERYSFLSSEMVPINPFPKKPILHNSESQLLIYNFLLTHKLIARICSLSKYNKITDTNVLINGEIDHQKSEIESVSRIQLRNKWNINKEPLICLGTKHARRWRVT